MEERHACMTTDVSDAAEIVGDTGIVVLPRDAHALAKGWERMINLSTQERYALGQRARVQIQTHYQIGEVVRRYQQLYRQLIQRGWGGIDEENFTVHS